METVRPPLKARRQTHTRSAPLSSKEGGQTWSQSRVYLAHR